MKLKEILTETQEYDLFYKGYAINFDQDSDGFFWLNYTPELPKELDHKYNKAANRTNAEIVAKRAIDELKNKGMKESLNDVQDDMPKEWKNPQYYWSFTSKKGDKIIIVHHDSGQYHVMMKVAGDHDWTIGKDPIKDPKKYIDQLKEIGKLTAEMPAKDREELEKFIRKDLK